ncbi:MAG: MBL fold metallo-hydrolase [Candidatus Omnitrophica bacterium]|nr:MBL fold metallo-hydrolase [Candidatus Omnitrophota bacterium]
MRVKLWGVRGSVAAPGPETARYGGNTSCVEVETGGQLFIIDAGTGIRPLGNVLKERCQQELLNAAVLIGHTHWDHIQGFPFFVPLYMKGNRFTIYGPSGTSKSLHEKLDGQMSWDYFPVSLSDVGSELEFRDVGEEVLDFDGVTVKTVRLHHPGSAVGYRIESREGAFVYCSDFEPHPATVGFLKEKKDIAPGLSGEEKKLIEFVRHADIWIADGQYIMSEYLARIGWGHSPLPYTLALAELAQVKRLIIFHHDPNHTDGFIDEMDAFARDYVAGRGNPFIVSFAAEGTELTVPDSARR